MTKLSKRELECWDCDDYASMRQNALTAGYRDLDHMMDDWNIAYRLMQAKSVSLNEPNLPDTPYSLYSNIKHKDGLTALEISIEGGLSVYETMVEFEIRGENAFYEINYDRFDKIIYKRLSADESLPGLFRYHMREVTP